MTERVTHPRIAPRARSSLATSWWGKAWVRALQESAFAETELRAGKSLARAGAVGAVTISTSGYFASVEDRGELWTGSAAVPPLDEAAADALIEAIGAEAGRLPALLAGELPHDLVEHAEDAGVELLPYGGELAADCPCPAWHQPCAHSLAVGFQVGWLMDRDPFVLLMLRGLTRDQVLAGVQAVRRADSAADERTDDVAVALDAAFRARRVLELLDSDAPGELSHLF